MNKTPLNKITSLLFAFALIVGAVSCKKDSDDPAPGGSANGVEGSWKISAITLDPAQNGISDALAFYEAFVGNKCLSQTTFIFKGDGTMGGNVPAGCQVDDDAPISVDQARWKVVGNKIELTEGTDVSTFDLETKPNEMRWSTTETDNGATYKMTVVFKKA